MGDSLYIATAKGLCVMSSESDFETAVRPVIELMFVNSNPFKNYQFPKMLAHLENNLTFQFKSLDLSLSGDIWYRTRLNQGEWVESKSTAINYASLAPGKYVFQVKAMNKNLDWSKTVEHTFDIRPPWWRTTAFIIFGMVSLTGLGYVLFRTRINQLKKENKVQKEIVALERSALQAQMNPHFIFNCLNSIQNYIMLNDKDMAMDYLGRFAHLIRQYLNASTSDLVTLEDEISMLENYLQLEQMRFNHSFDYRIDIAAYIDVTVIKIPPMLIQPFVENSVLHGMSSITSVGMISLGFFQNKDQLHITIKDNGKGFKSDKPDKLRKSLGVSITQKRLQYINENKEGNYSITTKSSEMGTDVSILIKTT